MLFFLFIRIHFEILFLLERSFLISISCIKKGKKNRRSSYWWSHQMLLMYKKHTKIKDEKEKTSTCLCFLYFHFVTICMTWVVGERPIRIQYVSFLHSLSFSPFSYLPFCLIESSHSSRIAFLLVILSNILPLEIESKLVLLLKYNIIVGESRKKSTQLLVESHSITYKIILNLF